MTAFPSLASAFACASVSPSAWLSRSAISRYFSRFLMFSGDDTTASSCGRPSALRPMVSSTMRFDSRARVSQYLLNWV